MADATPPIDESDLIRRMKAGEERAYEDMLRVFGGKLAGFLFKTYGKALDKDDQRSVLLYATFNAWRYAGKYDPSKASFAGWLIRITRNAAVSFLRREMKHRGKEQSLADHDPMADCDPDDPPAEARDRWEVVQLLDIIETELSPNERLITEADKAAGGKADDGHLSGKLICSRASVHSTRSKARRKIKESMERRTRDRGSK